MIPASTDAKLRAWLSFLEHTHDGSNTRDFITGCLTLTGVELTADEVDAVENGVTLGLENALGKIAAHLQEPGQASARRGRTAATAGLIPSAWALRCG